MIKRRSVTVSLAILLLSALIRPAGAADATVAITALVEHPVLETTRDGIRDGLAEAGYKAGENLTLMFETAQGNPATAAQIARKFVGEVPDVIVPITTPSAQAVVAATKDIPIVFSVVTDPLGAGLVASLDHPGGNVTGTTDLSPVAKQIDLITLITPYAGSIGVPYNPGEANSVTLVKLINQYAEKKGLRVIEAPAHRSAEVLSAAQSLVGKVDVIHVPTDNTVGSAIEAIMRVSEDHQIPVYASDTDSVSHGAIAALSFNYYDLGRQTGKIVARVLAGETPGDIAVHGADAIDLYVNPPVAARLGVTIPSALLAEAKIVGEAAAASSGASR